MDGKRLCGKSPADPWEWRNKNAAGNVMAIVPRFALSWLKNAIVLQV